MKAPKHHKFSSSMVSFPDGESLEDFIQRLHEMAQDLVDPKVTMDYDWNEIAIVGYVPMTEKEIAAAERKAKRERERKRKQKAEAEAKQREYELDMLKTLKAKYEGSS